MTCKFLLLFLFAAATTTAWSQSTQTYFSKDNFTVPAGDSSLHVIAYGGAGGGVGGGAGGKVVADLAVTPGQVLNINIGGNGSLRVAGANGGGSGGTVNGITFGGGGGATDLRIGGTALSDRKLVAGGGGYDATVNEGIIGGLGGGLKGGNGYGPQGGAGGGNPGATRLGGASNAEAGAGGGGYYAGNGGSFKTAVGNGGGFEAAAAAEAVIRIRVCVPTSSIRRAAIISINIPERSSFLTAP